jgi:hypothetical protein
MMNTLRILIRKSEVRKPLRRYKSRWEDNIGNFLKKVDVRMWAGFLWLRTASCYELL